jgi:hypothetical protein
MKVTIDSTFPNFLKSLDEKVLAIRTNRTTTEREKTLELRNLRKLSYDLASNTFTKDVKKLMTKHSVMLRFDLISVELMKKLTEQKIKYNIYFDVNGLDVVQIVRPDRLENQMFIEASVLAHGFFNIAPRFPEYNLLLGFIEDPKINEILQLAFFLVPSTMAV